MLIELKRDYEEYEKQGQDDNNRTGKGTMKKPKYYDKCHEVFGTENRAANFASYVPSSKEITLKMNIKKRKAGNSDKFHLSDEHKKYIILKRLEKPAVEYNQIAKESDLKDTVYAVTKFHQRYVKEANKKTSEFEIEDIVSHKAVFVGSGTQKVFLFKVRWLNHPASFDEWKLEAELEISAPMLLKRYKNECLLRLIT